MKETQNTAAKDSGALFSIENHLNGNLPVCPATACEKKCIRCNVSSKDCSHS